MKVPLVLPIALLSLPLSLVPGRDGLRTHYVAGTALRVDVETGVSLQVGVLTLVQNGKRSPYTLRDPMPEEGLAKRRFVDRFLRTEDGRRTEVERTFEVIQGTLGDLDPYTEPEALLTGRTLIIFEDTKANSGVQVHLDDKGETIDQRYLAGFDLTYPEELLLPATGIKLGDTWEFEGAEVLRCLGFDVGVDWFVPDDEVTFNPAAVVSKDMAGTTRVAYVANESDGEDTFARIEFTFDLEQIAAKLSLADFMRYTRDSQETFSETEIEVDATIEGSGVFWIDLDSGRLIGSESKAEATIGASMGRSDGDGETYLELELEVGLENSRSYTPVDDEERGPRFK